MALVVVVVRSSRLWSTIQLLRPFDKQSLRRGQSTDPRVTMWVQLEMMCIVYVSVTKGA